MGEQEIVEEAERQIRNAQLNATATKLSQTQQDNFIQEQEHEKGMIREQLDSSEDIDKIYNLVRGYIFKIKGGAVEWIAPGDNDMIILTEYGVQFVMGKIVTYLCKNTLLSNYDEKQINAKMEDISNNINDTIFMEYDKMFLYPTLEDCKKEIDQRIKSKIEVKKFALEMLGKKADEEKIEEDIIEEMENTIERELEIIKEQKMKSKLKRFESIVRDIQDTIHSAYQRAWKGQERTTLRQHTHISENKGGVYVPPQPQGFNPLNMLKRR